MVASGVVRVGSGLPRMSDSDSSGANDGLELAGAAESAAAPLRSAASLLLSAAEIWSTTKETPAPAEAPVAVRAPDTVSEKTESPEKTAPKRRPSELLAEARFFSSSGRRIQESAEESQPVAERTPRPAPAADAVPVQAPKAEITALAANANLVPPLPWPPRRLSLALQGGGSFGAFAWGVLERLLEEPDCEISAISGASVGAVNAALVACGLVKGGREGARRKLAQFWNRITNEVSFRSLMLIGGFSPAGSSVAFGPTLRSGKFDPFDLDPLREQLTKHIDFAAFRDATCPRLLIAATRVRDGRLKIFGNRDITADVLLASSCPPLVHCAVEIEGESYWDGGYAANPPVLGLLQAPESADVLVVQVTPSRDSYIPVTMAAIDRRLDQIAANAVLNAEIAGFELALGGPRCVRASSGSRPKTRSMGLRNAVPSISGAALSRCCTGAVVLPPIAGCDRISLHGKSGEPSRSGRCSRSRSRR
jgi:NTE family protein